MSWEGINNFEPYEFNSPDINGGGDKAARVFIERLDRTRECAGIPFVVNSGYRTKSHNLHVGGVPDSEHTDQPDGYFYAADIKAVNSYQKFKIVEAAILCGFKRIGVGKTFIHLGDSPYHPSERLWEYSKPSRVRKLVEGIIGYKSGVGVSNAGWKNFIIKKLFSDDTTEDR